MSYYRTIIFCLCASHAYGAENTTQLSEIKSKVAERVNALQSIAKTVITTLRAREKEQNTQRQTECNQEKQVIQSKINNDKKQLQEACNSKKKQLQARCADEKKGIQQRCNEEKKVIQLACTDAKKKVQDDGNDQKKKLQHECAQDKAERKERVGSVIATIKRAERAAKARHDASAPLLAAVSSYLHTLKEHARAAHLSQSVSALSVQEADFKKEQSSFRKTKSS